MVCIGLQESAAPWRAGQRTGAAAVARQRVVARFLFNGLLQRRQDVVECVPEERRAGERGSKYEAMLRVGASNNSSSSSKA
jgi:hypothetical protein